MDQVCTGHGEREEVGSGKDQAEYFPDGVSQGRKVG